MAPSSEWFVYVIQSQEKRAGRRGNPLPGWFYVGASTDPRRRLRQHNGEIQGGSKYTSKHRPWCLMAVWGPYPDQSTALKAEHKLKHSKRGTARLEWTPHDSPYCTGAGVGHLWVLDARNKSE